MIFGRPDPRLALITLDDIYGRASRPAVAVEPDTHQRYERQGLW